MSRDELIKFLTENYEPDTELIWQTMRYEDLEGIDGATPELWSKFIELENDVHLANDYTENAFNAFYEFVENGGENND
jgi:hypothetical protein